MRIGELSALSLALGLVALTLAAASPAAARSLEGYWELRVKDVNGPPGCQAEKDTVVLLTESNGRAEGTLGNYFYWNIESSGDTVSAGFAGNWDGALGSPAVEAELNARNLPVRFRGRVTEGGNQIVAEELSPCANHRGDVLNWVRDITNEAHLQRVDLAITFVEQTTDAWREVSRIGFDRPFRIEVRASRALRRTSYPVMLAWGAGREPTSHHNWLTVERVGDDATHYRSGPITFARLGNDAPESRTSLENGVQVIMLAPDDTLHAVAGERWVLAFAATLRARSGGVLEIVLALAVALALGFAAMMAAPLAAAKFGLGRRALSRGLTRAGDAPAEAEDGTEPDSGPEFSATAHRDCGTQRLERFKPGEAPVIRFRAGAGQVRSSIDLETTAA